MTFTLQSPAFQSQGAIPKKYTCDGDDVSPALRWSGVPSNAKSLALIVDDPDAPDPKAPKRVYAHWLLYDIPPTASELPEGVKHGQLPKGTREGSNDWHRTGYGGPCPPVGRHRYFFKLFALDRVLGDIGAPSKKELETAIAGHVIGTAELMGTYEHPR